MMCFLSRKGVTVKGVLGEEGSEICASGSSFSVEFFVASDRFVRET
jgi:hypothetical protein